MSDAAPYTLKSFFSADVVRRLGREVARAWPAFPARAFQRDAIAGLEALELLDRGRHIGAALGAHLPQDYARAVDVLLRSLGPEQGGDENLGGGMAPFFYMPHLVFITARGLDDFDLSMRAQHELTKRFTAEFSIRAFIAHDPERAFAYLDRWAADPNAHNTFIVDGAPRKNFATETTKGVNWGLNVWHKVRIERRVKDGTIKVFFDDMSTPIMTATNDKFKSGGIGFGSFDDTGRIDNIRIWGPAVESRALPAFPKE